MKTRITELLGIRYPIIQGGMQWLAYAELAAAVSNAGGLGIISATCHEDKESLVAEIKKTQALTDKPFGVNISMLPVELPGDKTNDYVAAVLENGVKVVETAGRSPQAFIKELQAADVKVIHKVPAVRFAKKAEEIGADAVTIVGYECGGHPGMDDVAGAVLVNKASRQLSIPVLAGGGFVDGRGLVSALANGAEGIVVGTRFVAAKECNIHDNFKQWMLDHDERDTMMVERNIKNALRVARTPHAYHILGLEATGAGMNELHPLIRGAVGKAAYKDGRTNECTFCIGQDIGLIDSIESAGDIVANMVKEAEAIYAQRLREMFA